MYAVVGCNRCSALWVVEGRPETTSCPRCRKRHRFRKLKTFAEAETSEGAKEARSRLLQEQGGVNADLDDFAAMGRDADEAGIDDDEYLEASGVDADAVDEAAARAESGGGSSKSRREVVRAALRELDRPTEDEVVDYAAERDVPPDYTRTALAKLVRAGEVSESRGRYRPL